MDSSSITLGLSYLVHQMTESDENRIKDVPNLQVLADSQSEAPTPSSDSDIAVVTVNGHVTESVGSTGFATISTADNNKVLSAVSSDGLPIKVLDITIGSSVFVEQQAVASPDKASAIIDVTKETIQADLERDDLPRPLSVNRSVLDDYWRNESICLLAFSKLKGMGYHNMRALAGLGESYNKIFCSNTMAEFEEFLKRAKCRLSSEVSSFWFRNRRELWVEARELLKQLTLRGVQVLHAGQTEFPNMLNDAEGPPKWLFVQGNLEALHRPMLGVVGTRNPTDDGLFLAKYIGASLPVISTEMATVSGLAPGIDQTIHVESIRSGIPTVAVLGTGIFSDYPHGTAELKKEICVDGGALVTEYFPNESYGKENFVLRNRLQAAFCSVLIPAEWKAESGTAHTVRFAGGMGRSIVCLRLPAWQDDHTEFAYANKFGGQMFTVPGQESELFDFLRHGLSVKPIAPIAEVGQLNLFTQGPVREF